MNNKNIIFGTSFVNTFISLKSDNFIIVKFKGAMIKGLLDKNDNYYDIIDILKSDYYDRAFFLFGNPDCNFYFYKKKYIDGEEGSIIEKNILENAKKYVEMINIFNNIGEKYILGVSPSPIISDKDFKLALSIYGVITDKNILKNINKNDIKYKKRLERCINFNNILEENCKKYNIKFCNIFNNLLNNKKYLDKLFRLPMLINVHYNFEAALIVYLNTCLKFLMTNKKETYKLIRESHKKYLINLKNRYNLNKKTIFYKFNIKLIESFIVKSFNKSTH